MHYLFYFLAGLVLCNGIPHLAAGLRGEPFPTPFAKPPGAGLSSPVVNVLWGTANLAGGVFLIRQAAGPQTDWAAPAAALTGFLLIGVFCARHFGRWRAGSRP